MVCWNSGGSYCLNQLIEADDPWRPTIRLVLRAGSVLHTTVAWLSSGSTSSCSLISRWYEKSPSSCHFLSKSFETQRPLRSCEPERSRNGRPGAPLIRKPSPTVGAPL